MSGLYNPPQNLAEVRERLFSVSETVLLPAADFEVYWSHVDNFWSPTKKPQVYEGGRTVRYFRCVQHSKKYHKPEGKRKALRQRQKPSRTAIGCPMTMRVVTEAGLVTVDQIGEGLVHTHTMEDSDRWKNPSFIRTIVDREVAKGYRVADVTKALEKAGGLWTFLKDVQNAEAAWRKQNPDSCHYGSAET